MYGRQIREFRDKIAKLPREEILEIIQQQNPKLIVQIKRIEWVFENKLKHLTWPDGTQITGRPITNDELALLVDQPFTPDPELTQMGLTTDQQLQVHISADPVLWARHYLKANPRVYQIFMLRSPRLRKVLRAGRRLGKSWMMAVKMLHQAYTSNDGRILVMAPMKSQVELLYREVLRLASKSEVVFSSIERKVTSPQFFIEFKNGSTISFFTTGMRSGGKADVARGQEAHLIILDELDYMSPDDLVAIYVMLQDTQEGLEPKELVGASTPTGLREHFWAWCNNPRFQEFWFPSYCNPMFKKETEEEFREQYSEMAYRHEVEADWGESTEGVYPRRYVEKAFNTGLVVADEDATREDVVELSDWGYNLEPVGEAVRVIGVDWDKYGAGVNIAVLEICGPDHPDKRFRDRIRCIFREEMKKDEYALIKAVERVKKLNTIFDPRHIYVDKGNGEVQIELLHQYGIEHPHTGLRKKVKGVAFGGWIEVRDPANKKFEKKEMKPFMVENLRFMLEKEQIVFPSSDADLYLQFISYVVARTTQTGRPVFETAGNVPDHAHDAVLLACHAINENFNELLRTNVARRGMIAVSNSQMTGMPGPNPNEPSVVWDDKVGYKKNRAAKGDRLTRPMSAGVKMGRTSIRRKMF